jgi:hypothetical protein
MEVGVDGVEPEQYSFSIRSSPSIAWLPHAGAIA